MSLSILNSVSSLIAENSLSQTAASQQKVLQELSSGLRINTSSDDAAGLMIATGLQANTAALAQSYANANNGISLLQVADGALSQVTSLLNRAITLATESASSELTSQQRSAVDTEYQSILAEIVQIGTNTQFNGTQVFTDGNSSPVTLTSGNGGTTLTSNIDPADSLSGSLTLTTVVPGNPGVTQGVATQDYGWISLGTITPGATLTGGLTVNSTTPGSNAVTSGINVVNNSDGSIFIPISNSADALSGSLTVSTVVPGTSGAAQSISLVNSSSNTLIGSVDPADTLSGTLSVTSTTAATGGVQSAMSLTSGGGGTTITGTIPPADSLGGSLTITSTIPQSGGVSSAVSLTNGSSITGNVGNGNTLSGSVTFTSTTAASGGVSSGVTLTNNGATITGHITSGDAVNGSVTVTSTIPKPQTPTFSASGSGSSEAITSSVITTGVPLAGTLLINSTYIDRSGAIEWSGTQKTTTGTVNLANYQNLASSNVALASMAATQLGLDLTTSLGAITGNSYTATLSGGVLTIKTSNPWWTQASDNSGGLLTNTDPSNGGSVIWLPGDPLTGTTLSGTMAFFFQPDNGGGARRSNISVNSANYQGLTSGNSIAVANALSQLSKDMTAQCVSGTTLTATITSVQGENYLVITSNEMGAYAGQTSLWSRGYNAGEQMSVGSGDVAFSVSGSGTSQVITSSAIATGTTLSGTLVVNSTGTAKTDGQIPSATLNLSNYGGLSSSNAATASAAATQLAADLTTALKPSTGSTYTATMSGGVLTIKSGNAGSSQSLDFISSGGGKILTSANPLIAGATLGGNFKILADGTSFNLSFNKYAGLTSLDASTRNQALQKLSQDITMFTWVDTTASINSNGNLVLTVGGSDTISDSGNEFQTLAGQTAGEQLSLGSQSAQEVFNNLPVSTPTAVTLSNVATANLQTTLQSQLGSNYAVTYNNSTGALNIGISSAGKSAGITSIAESSNSLQQKTPVVNPVSTPTVVNLNGVTSANLLSTLQSALNSSIYSVNYNSSTGALTVSETSAAQSAGTTISSTTNNLQQTTPVVAAQVTPVTVNLNGVSTSSLQSKLSTALGPNYTVGYNSGTGALSISISATGTAAGVKTIAFSGSPTQTTPIVGGTSVTKNVDLTGVTSSNLLTTLQNDLGAGYNVTYDTNSGALNISAVAGGTTLSANSGTAQETGPGSPEVDTPTNIDLTGQTGATLANYLSNQLAWWNYSVTQDSNGVTVSPMWWDQMIYGIQSVKATNVQAFETTPAVQPVTTPTNINLTGVATSDLQQTIQNALGSDYGVYYDTNSGFLEVYLNWGNQDNYSTFSTSSTLQQNTGSSAPVNTSSTINLTGVSPTNLESSIVSQLGSAAGNYDVHYDTNSGALSIALSSAGTNSGIQSITSNTSGLTETAPDGTIGLSAMRIFTSDGTTNGGYSLDVTVGSLTTASLGKSNGSAGTDLSSTNLNSQTSAASALSLITAAVGGISSQRGVVGANINRLSATASNIGTEQVNLTAASNSILNADLGKTVANMTQYNILQSTGMAALQQSNQAQQAVLKLLQ
jgi:flagellin